MKLVARIATAFALLAFATPALPCGEKQQTTATKEHKKPAVAETKQAEKKDASAAKKAVSEKKAKATPTPTATAAN